MGRLTEKDAYWYGEEFWTSAKEPDDETIDEVYMKLKEYEDAEEQGLLVKLPCKVGDTVYNLVPRAKKGNEYNTDKVEKIVIRDNSVLLLFECGLGKYIDQIGKSMFLTKEEAEAALAKLESEV